MLKIERWIFNIFLATFLIIHLNYRLNISHFSLIFTAADIFLGLIIILYVIRIFKYENENNEIISKRKIFFPLLLLISTMFVSIIKNYPKSNVDYLFLWIKFLFIFYYAYINYGNTVKIEDINRILLLFILVEFTVCSIQYITHTFWGCLPNYLGQGKFNVTTEFKIGNIRGMRALGTSFSPNLLAALLFIALLTAHIDTNRIKSFIFVFLGVITIAMTLSRGIMILMLFVLLLLSISQKEIAKTALLIISLFIVYYLLKTNELEMESLRFGSSTPMGLRRLVGIKISLNIFRNSSFWGIGFGYFQNFIEIYNIERYLGVRVAPAHNIFFLYLTEGGVFVAISILLMLFYLSKVGLSVFFKISESQISRYFSISLLVMIILLNAYLFCNVSNFIYLFAIVSAIVFINYDKNLLEESEGDSKLKI